MRIPTSALFSPLPLNASFNHKREELDQLLRIQTDGAFGTQICRGIPFAFGPANQNNVILLHQNEMRIATGRLQASFILFAHTVENRPIQLTPDLADYRGTQHRPSDFTGNELGDLVAEYQLRYDDGSQSSTAIRRRFAIQQAHIGWGASPFEAVEHRPHQITPTISENLRAGAMPRSHYGDSETRHQSGRDSHAEHIWLYALPNPHPHKTITAIHCIPKNERALIFAITTTQISEHPLRAQTRRKLALTLPDSVQFNANGELPNAAIDIGYVISARAKLEYNREQWFSSATNAQPQPSERVAIIEYAAHPRAKLYLLGSGGGLFCYDLANLDGQSLVEVPPANRIIKIKIVDPSGKPVPARVHFHGQAGEYLPPRGNHRRVNGNWFEDNYGEFLNHHNQYAYIDGQCEVEAPLGEVFVEITRGYEIKPFRGSIQVTPDTDEFIFPLEKVLDWRERGWVTADTHVHFLSPQTALLEGSAEGVNVVNLLASQWGEMFSNVSDFDGRSTLGARDFGGDGEFLVRVGTENRMQVLGHISLLGYSGPMIHPLCSGGPSESAIGDPLDLSMADWAQRCIEQNGLVISPHAPNPQAERAADIVLGLVHAIEMMTFNPFDAQITPYGLLDWYGYLNLGCHIPIVGGSDKMSAASLLGGIRTYAHLADREFTYENWMTSVKDGDTFVTVGPLLELQVEGQRPGSQLDLSASGGTVTVTWRVASAAMPIETVEIILGGFAVESQSVAGALEADGTCQLRIDESTWIALRVRGSHSGSNGDIAAHSSAIMIRVDGARPFKKQNAMALLEQIEGAIAFVDTLAPRPAAQKFKQIRATLESAHNRLHQRMHQQGIYHQHNPLHTHHEP